MILQKYTLSILLLSHNTRQMDITQAINLSSLLRKYITKYKYIYNFESGNCLHFGLRCVTRLTRQVSLVEQEMLTIPEHLSSPPVFSGVRVTR